MNVLWVVAPPDPRSLTATLAARGIAALRADGHTVEVSDLPAMHWNPVITAAEYGVTERLKVSEAAGAAYAAGTLPEEVRAEQEKIRRADTLVLQFPMWWFGMPAILKGWVERVFVNGFAYGVRAPEGHTRRYGDGILAGKRALVVTTTGGPAASFGPRGLSGELEELMFPLLHGTLFYTGATVLAPHLIAGADRYTAEDAEEAGDALVARLGGLEADVPIPYWTERRDYAKHILHPHIAPDEAGLSAHRNSQAHALSLT